MIDAKEYDFPSCVAVVGSRSFAKFPKTDTFMHDLVSKFVRMLPEDTEIVSGGARGVDSYAEEAARLFGRRHTIYIPDKKLPSPQRFFARNTEIVQHVYKYQGMVVAFIDLDKCSGTEDTITKAKKLNMPVLCYEFRMSPLTFVKVGIR